VPSALHHSWIPAHAEDGGQYLRCKHCGKDKTEVDLGDFDGKNVAAGSAGA
jgi:hypothetical protein